MICDPTTVGRILAGEQTRITRPHRGHKLEPGRHYAVQSGARRRAVCRVLVLSVSEPLSLLSVLTSDEAIRAEGHDDRDAMLAAWRDRHGSGAEQLPVVVVHFRLHTPQAPGIFLHRDSSRGYTTRPELALPDEGEAVDPDEITQLPDATAQTRRTFELEHHRRAAKSRAARMREVEALALARGVDLSAEVDAIELALKRADQKVRRRVA